jgi:hypothetical protein
VNNNVTVNNIATTAQNVRQPSTPNGTFIHHQQQPFSSGTITTPTSIVRLNQPLPAQNQFTTQTVWANNAAQISPKIQYSPTVKNGKTFSS